MVANRFVRLNMCSVLRMALAAVRFTCYTGRSFGTCDVHLISTTNHIVSEHRYLCAAVYLSGSVAVSGKVGQGRTLFGLPRILYSRDWQALRKPSVPARVTKLDQSLRSVSFGNREAVNSRDDSRNVKVTTDDCHVVTELCHIGSRLQRGVALVPLRTLDSSNTLLTNAAGSF